MRIGVLTGGGDCPGLNAVIRAVVRKGVERGGHEFVGYRDGWHGPLERDSRPLGVPEVRGILPRGGTILGSSRTNPFKEEGGPERLIENLDADGVEGLIAIGGEDTLGVAARLHREHGVYIVGVPKTVVEVMGRHAGWIAFHSGLAGGANVILIPEQPFDLDRVCEFVGRRFEHNFAPIVVVAEGAQPVGGMPETKSGKLDQFGHVALGGIAHWLEGEIESRTGKEARATVLGHVQRGGTPTAFDRVLATRFGLHAIDAVDAERWGTMTALRGTDIQLVGLDDAVARLKTVPPELYGEAEVFFG
jgi:6-phosphofructokinase